MCYNFTLDDTGFSAGESEGDAMPIEERVGPAIRRLRKEQDLTLTDLADASGLSPSHISQIERGLTSPSLTSLRQISEALDVRLSQLILAAEPASIGADRFISRSRDRTLARFLGTNIDYQLISREGSDIQLLWVESPPGERMERHVRTDGGEECGFVISGRMRVVIDGSEGILGPGDAVFIGSDMEHTWESLGSEELTVIWTITPPLTQLVHLNGPGTAPEGEAQP
jgi:transcriptional regulator with XRE-family HTH domain